MRIGDLLVNSGFISQEELDRALVQQKSSDTTPIGQLLCLLNYLGHDDLELVLQAQRKILFSSMPGSLAINSIRYAKQHRVSFNQASQAVLARMAAASPQLTKATKTLELGSQAKNSSQTQVDEPSMIIQQSDVAASEQRWEAAIMLLDQARAIYDSNNGYPQDALIPVYCRQAAIYLKTDRAANAKETMTRATKLLVAGISLSPGSLSLLAASAMLFSKHGNAQEAHNIYQFIIPKWAAILPFESGQFCVCLRDAVLCSRQVNKPCSSRIRMGELLILSGLISSEQFQNALQSAKRTRRPLGRTLSESALIKMQDLRNAVRVQLLCRSAALPPEYAPYVIKAASYSKLSAREFFAKITSASEAQNYDAATTAELIAKMDELLILEEQKGLQDPEVALLTDAIGEICLNRGEPEEAEAMFRRAHAGFAIAGENYQIQFGNECQKIGRLLMQQKKYPESELLLLQSMEIKSRIFGDRHPEVADILLDVGYLYFCQAVYEAAIGFLRSAWMIQQDDSTIEKKRYLLELLIKCFEQSAQPSEADIYKEQLQSLDT